jgi:hypothetical protein
MTTHNLVESVARAICRTQCSETDSICAGGCQSDGEALVVAFGDVARAAVVAVLKGIREPSDQAIADGVNFLIDANLDGPDGVGHSDAVGCWQAMSDALLAQIEGGSDETE